MNNEDSLLIAGICGALHQLEEQHKWDLSTGEIAAFLQVFYNRLKPGLPNNRAELQEIFNNAYIHVYGEDHECDLATTEEMLVLLDHCSDYYIEIAPEGANIIHIYDEFRSVVQS